MAVNNPEISNYKPFYIQYGENAIASDTRATWGLIAKTNPYPILPTPKEPYKNDWKDQDGDDEYNTVMKYEAFVFDVSFYIRASGSTAASDIRGAIATFFNAIKQGEFKIYDAYTAIGRQKVRYAGYKEESFSDYGGKARCIFTVTFKVNDPVTLMKLNDSNAIVTV